MNVTLDSIREAAEAKYGSLDIEVGDKTIRLLNPLRLPQAKRNALMALQEKKDDDSSDQLETLREMIRLVVDTEANGKALIKAVGDDLAVMAELMSTYGSQTQVGEASA